MPVNYSKLDNPAWHALTETHANFALGNDTIKRYDPTVVLFAGYDLKEDIITQKFKRRKHYAKI